MAVCLSVHRLEHLDRLATCFLAGREEGGGACHVFAAVKGMTQDCYRETALLRYAEWVKQGYMTLGHYPKKNQVSDLADTVRGMELAGYDLFFFPRENLLISPGLVRLINHICTRQALNAPLYGQGPCVTLTVRNGIQHTETPAAPEVPPFYLLTRAAVETLLECEKKPEHIARLYPDGKDPKHGAYGRDADALLMRIIQYHGGREMAALENEPVLLTKPETPPCTNNPLAEAEETLHESIMDDPTCAEHLIELDHPYWKDHFRILGTAGCRVKAVEKAIVLRYTENELVVQWEEWGRERFSRENGRGPYRLDDRRPARTRGQKGKQRSGQEETPESLIARALAEPALRWGVCAVALPRESCYWLRDWIELHLRAGASLVVIYDNTGSGGSLRFDNPFCSGVLQREGKSKRGEEYGRLTAHLSDEDIRRELEVLTARYGKERVRVETWQPRDPKSGVIVHGQVEAYDDFIRKYRMELDWCAFIDLDEYLYCRPDLSIGGILEQVERETPEVGRLVMKGWKFRMRWGTDGPRDIRKHLDHLPLCDGGEKNLVRLCDVKEADIHWYWTMRRGCEKVDYEPFEMAFCHYNIDDREMEEAGTQRLIEPRAFLAGGERQARDQLPEMKD